MNIQFYPNELDYVNAKLRPSGHTDESSFLGTFLLACTRADSQNYELLRPVLHELMRKYPADPKSLAAEERRQNEADDRIDR